MTQRTLRRKTLMREYDYNKVREQAIMPLRQFEYVSLYDRCYFIPLNQEGLEKLRLLDILKGKDTPLLDPLLDLNKPAMLLYKLKDYLYNEKYHQWTVSTDSEGVVCVQARKNTPVSRIGMAIFEKDYECKI